jgi:glycosyltransferase involved in cell wall biosynthesis
MHFMKIQIVVPYFTPFYKQNEYGLAESLSKKGHEVTILTSNRKMKKFYFDSSEREPGRRVEEEIAGFTVVYLPTLIDVLEQPLMPSLSGEVTTRNAEVVHVHEDFQNCSLLASRAAGKKSIPVVLSQERYYLPEGFWKFQYLLYSAVFARQVRDRAAMITAHSNAAKEFLVSQGTKSERIDVVPVGVDPDEFKPSTREILTTRAKVSGNKIILTVARLHPNKGLTYLLQAMPKVIEEHPSSNLVIIGRGPTEEQIRRLMADLKLEDHVTLLTDPIPNEDMNRIYPGCDLFVLPSVKEPFGRVILEAMACGKPVISTRVGGPLDIVEDGKTGYLVDRADPGQLACRINELLQDPKKIRDFGVASRRRIVERFDWEKLAIKYSSIYKSVSSRAHTGTV